MDAASGPAFTLKADIKSVQAIDFVFMEVSVAMIKAANLPPPVYAKFTYPGTWPLNVTLSFPKLS